MTLRWLPSLSLLLCLLLPSSHSHGHGHAPHRHADDMTLDEMLMRTNRDILSKHRSSRSAEDGYMSGMDMKLTASQYRRLHGGETTRKAGDHMLATPWTNGVIPYEIHTQDFNSDQLAWIHKAMNDWANLTCVRFRPATSSDTDHKILIRKGSGCWAHLGMIDEYPQIVNLEADGVGCFWKGLIHHELGHTIGLIHEHQRENRDAYIRVDYYMVMSNMIDAVEKYARGADTKKGLPYDYKSVMHYGKTAFSSGFYRHTIYTRDPDMEDVIGFTLLPSFLDTKLVNLMYNCKDRCHSPPSCHEPCFVNERCECVCEDDMPKEHCQDLFSDCASRAADGGCVNHYGSMHHSCRKTCGICNDDGSVPHLLCVDRDSDCHERAARGECESDFGRMQYDCRLSCGLCKTPDMLPSPGPCADKNSSCPALAAKGSCFRDMPHMLLDCKKSCEFCPENLGVDPSNKTGCVDYDPGACYYRADSNLCDKFYTLMSLKCPVACEKCTSFTLPPGCVDSNTECPGWAFRDECENNPGYMLKECAKSCDQCDGLNKPDLPCQDYSIECADYVHRNECWANPNWMLKNCQKSCKNCSTDPPFGVPCLDFNSRCPQWASEGECTSNKGWMWPHCRLSCGQCTPGTWDFNNGTCRDNNWECYYWSVQGECDANPGFMRKECRKSCGECTDDGGGSTGTPGHTHPTHPTHGPVDCPDDNTNCPMWAEDRQCYKNPGYMLKHCRGSCKNCLDTCEDSNPNCAGWADYGECTNNPGYMLKSCQSSCGVCH